MLTSFTFQMQMSMITCSIAGDKNVFSLVPDLFKYNVPISQEAGIVYLVDGSSYLHRAFHAIRNLANSKGFPTNAVLGFTKMALKLINDKKPGKVLFI